MVGEGWGTTASAASSSALSIMLSQELSLVYPKGYSPRNMRNCRQFYFRDLEIWHSHVPNLLWSHYRTFLFVADDDARYWDMKYFLLEKSRGFAFMAEQYHIIYHWTVDVIITFIERFCKRLYNETKVLFHNIYYS